MTERITTRLKRNKRKVVKCPGKSGCRHETSGTHVVGPMPEMTTVDLSAGAD
jgi:hypothetical protein